MLDRLISLANYPLLLACNGSISNRSRLELDELVIAFLPFLGPRPAAGLLLAAGLAAAGLPLRERDAAGLALGAAGVGARRRVVAAAGFFLTPARQFLSALDVWSSKIDCFIVDPI